MRHIGKSTTCRQGTSTVQLVGKPQDNTRSKEKCQPKKFLKKSNHSPVECYVPTVTKLQHKLFLTPKEIITVQHNHTQITFDNNHKNV